MTDFFFIGIGVNALNCLNIGGGRHIIDNRVEKRLNALITVRSTAGNRHHGVRNRRFANGAFNLFNGKFFAVEVFFHQLFILLGDMLDKLFTVFLCQLFHIVRDRLTADILAKVVIIDFCIHFDQVDNALKGVLTADRQLNRNGVALETLIDHIQHAVEVRAHNVHFIDINHTRNMVFVSLTPNGFRLRLNTALGAKNGNGTVQNTKRTLHFNGEVNVAGRVDNIDTVLFPETGGRSGGDGNPSLLLLRHPVHGGIAVVGFTDFMVYTRVKQNTLSGCRFTGVDVRHNTNISCFFKRYLSRHNILQTLLKRL